MRLQDLISSTAVGLLQRALSFSMWCSSRCTASDAVHIMLYIHTHNTEKARVKIGATYTIMLNVSHHTGFL